MTGFSIMLCALGVLTLAVIALVVRRPESVGTAGGKILAFVALVVLPGLLLLGGAEQHYQQAKTTQFCLSCHTLGPYGESLRADHPSLLPASHYQNRRIPTDRACYACHTNYAMFGDFDDKVRGVRHVWHHVWGTASNPVELYAPYENRSCFECHQGARSYEEHPDHARFHAELLEGSKSCLMCHNLVHEVDTLDRYPRWEGDVVP